MNIVPRLGLLATVGASIAVCAAPVAFAETTVVEIKANDTLGAIISDAYPGYRNRDALMQLILERNPQAFVNNNINFLVLGKTLNLPGADELGAAIEVAPPPPPVQQVVSPVIAAEAESKLKQMTEQRDQLRQQLEQLETDNKALRDTVSRLEATGIEQSEQLKKLEEQIEALKSDAEEQLVAAETPSSEIVKQLAESGRKLEQLQTRYDESIKDNQGLQQQLTEKAALESEASELKKQLSELQGGGVQKTANTELQSQLDALKQQSESLRADNEKVVAELNAVSAKLEVSESEADALRTELEASNKQLEVSQSDVATLRTELNTSNENNTALSSEMGQIKAATETDVTLAPVNPSEKPGSTWWPWLLALLLLPVAWLLGQRSRPVSVIPVAEEAKAGVKTIEIAAAADPVVPEALTSDQLDQMAFSGIKTVTTPDDPDAAIKLDMARAYLDLRNAEAANDVLKEVIQEGGSRQQQEAKEIQSFIA
ncbi:MAG: Unknown protein [uncultured Thiotrichaceae bacterium]|uniref:LysM domain-containing protein n=1 Tax=uncultured Thiotrichaceae bacterium TaxID=298394 RepID=A0A6S6U447_9GAMM|nr:MAG: Unknown protein [uncultured Thiotrichaceae bacterium]